MMHYKWKHIWSLSQTLPTCICSVYKSTNKLFFLYLLFHNMGTESCLILEALLYIKITDSYMDFQSLHNVFEWSFSVCDLVCQLLTISSTPCRVNGHTNSFCILWEQWIVWIFLSDFWQVGSFMSLAVTKYYFNCGENVFCIIACTIYMMLLFLF